MGIGLEADVAASPEERFWAKVDRAGPDECWPWKYSVNPRSGLAATSVAGRAIYAHRWSYEQAVGSIPLGHCVRQRCGNKRCVNPAHLFASAGHTTTSENTKICKRCGEDKTFECYRRNGTTGWLYARCIPCQDLTNLDYRKANPERVERWNRAKKARQFGMSPEEYDEMLERQAGLCAICGEPETHTMRGKVLQLAIDHCHRTGRVRGLLCSLCNTALGHARDDPEILRRAANYLERAET